MNEPYDNKYGKGCVIFSAIFLLLFSFILPIGIIEILNKFIKIEHSIWSYLKVNLAIFIIFTLILITSEIIYKWKQRKK